MRLALTLLCVVFVTAAAQRAKTIKPNPPPIISSFESSVKSLSVCLVPVDPDVNQTYCNSNRRTTVTLQVAASDQPQEILSYQYSSTVGQIIGEGARVTWDLSGAIFGTHKVTVTVRNSRGAEARAFTTVVLGGCSSCVTPGPPCPTVAIKTWTQEAHRGEHVLFEVAVSPPEFVERPNYIWSITGGKILKGEHTPRVEVLITGEIDGQVTASVQVSAFDAACTATSASHTLPITP